MAEFPNQEEIAAHAEFVSKSDMFGFELSELLDWLDFEHAKPFLKETATREGWLEGGRPYEPTHDCVLKALRDYMPFAWEKANNNRGISAWRSLAHMQAWLWLLGETEAAARLRDYSHYGKPQLRAICERYGIDWQSLDDGRWTNSEMAGGSPPMPAANLPWTGEP
jgi:hypothetical protein